MRSKHSEVTVKKLKEFFNHVREENFEKINEFLKQNKRCLYEPLNDSGVLAFHLTAECGHSHLLVHFYFVDPLLLNKPDKLNRTALHFAAANGHAILVELLLGYGADLDISAVSQKEKQHQDTTALGYAKAANHPACVKILLRKKIDKVIANANPDLVNQLIDTLENEQLFTLDAQVYLIHRLAEAGYLAALQYLLEKTGNYAALNQKAEQETGALHLAAQNGKVPVLNYLLEMGVELYLDSLYAGTNINTADSLTPQNREFYSAERFISEFTPAAWHFPNLLTATQNGDLEIVKFLVEQGVDMNILTGNNKCHLIHYAAFAGHLELVKYFLSQNRELINVKDLLKQTPILYATTQGRAAVVSFLITEQADLNAKTWRPGHPEHEKSLLDWASENEHHYITCLLLLQKTKNNRSKLPSLIFKAEEAFFLIKTDPSLKTIILPDQRISCLMEEFIRDSKSINFIQEKPQESLGCFPYSEPDPLAIAKANKQEESVKILQKAYFNGFKSRFSGDINQRHNLEKATKYGHSEIVYYLLEAGGGLDVSLMQIAVKQGHLDLVQNFLSRDKSLLSSALICDACFEGYEEIVKYLLQQASEKLVNKELVESVQASGQHKIISLLILAAMQEDKAAIPALIKDADQAIELINLDPSLSDLIMNDACVLNLFKTEGIQIKASHNLQGQTLELYKPANNRDSMYLRVNRQLKTGKQSSALFKPEKVLGKSDHCHVRQFSTEEGQKIAVKSCMENQIIYYGDEARLKNETKKEIHFTRLANEAEGIHKGFYFFSGDEYNYRFVQPCYPGLPADVFMLKIQDTHKLAEVVYLIACELLKKHKKKIVHGDFKQDNVLISEDLSIKIIDYGHAASKNEPVDRISLVNSLFHTWYAPECVGEGTVYAKTSQDIFSFAVMLDSIFIEHPCREQLLQLYPAILSFMEKARSSMPSCRPKLSSFCQELLMEINRESALQLQSSLPASFTI